MFLILQQVCPDLPSCPQDIMKIWMKSVQHPQYPSRWRMTIHRQWTRKKRLLQSKSLVMLLWSVLPLSSLVWWLSLRPLGNSPSPCWVGCILLYPVVPVQQSTLLMGTLRELFSQCLSYSACVPVGIFNCCIHCQCFRSWRNEIAACRFILPSFQKQLAVALWPHELELKVLKCLYSLTVFFW